MGQYCHMHSTYGTSTVLCCPTQNQGLSIIARVVLLIVYTSRITWRWYNHEVPCLEFPVSLSGGSSAMFAASLCTGNFFATSSNNSFPGSQWVWVGRSRWSLWSGHWKSIQGGRALGRRPQYWSSLIAEPKNEWVKHLLDRHDGIWKVSHGQGCHQV